MIERILVLNPPFKESYNREVRFQAVSPQHALHPPIMLAYAAALLKKNNFQVELLDAPAMQLSFEETIERAKKFKPDLIAMLVSTASVISDSKLAGKLKKETRAAIVAVGIHASAVPEDTIKRGFDIVARGEYEHTVLEIAKGKKLSEILGISFKGKNGRIKHNETRPLIQNLDELPFPARHFLPNEKYYSALYRNPFTFIYAGRGCPFQCIYCAMPQLMYGRGYRLRSVENVIAELKQIKREFPKIKSVLFNDDTLTANKKHLLELCSAMISERIKMPWACYSRVDTIDEELARAMKKAGCFLVKVGFESGNDQVLQNMKKGANATTRQGIECARIFRKVGIQVHGTFIFGMPGETKETIRQTIEFAKKLNIDFVQFSVAQPYPGTEFYEHLKERKLLKFENWSDFLDEEGCITPIFEYSNLKKEDFKKMLKQAYKEYYLRPSYLAKALRNRLTNWNLLKTSLRSGLNLLNYLKS